MRKIDRVLVELGGINSRLERVEVRLDRMHTRLYPLDTRIDGVHNRLDTVIDSIADLRTHFDRHTHEG